MAEIGCNWARIGPSKSSQSLSIAHKWAVEIDIRAQFGLTSLIVILLVLPGPSDGLRLHLIVFFSSGSGLTADSSVLTLTLAFLDFGLDFAQSFPFHAHFVLNDNDGKMIEKNFIEIEGTVLVKIRDNAFNGIKGENVFEHINNFLEIVEPLTIKGVSQNRFRLSVFPISLSGATSKWFTNECIGTISTWDDLVEKFIQKFYNLSDHHEDEETSDENNPNITDNVPEIFKIEEDVFNFDTPLWVKTYDEYEQELNNEKTQGLNEQWSKNGVPYQLSDHICESYRFKNGITKWPTCSSDTDVYCNGGELPGMVRVGRMTYFQDHKWYDKMIDRGLKQETLKYKAQIEESWGDATPGVMKFCAWLKNSFKNFHELDYDVLVKLEECWWRVNTNEVCPFTPCKIRRFEMTKYTFEANEEYMAIKELEHINHSETNMNASYAYGELFRKIDDGWLVTRANDE
ncbi:hypothetical protein Tco_0771456 [Tanacetum coccineum]|uniref:Uncharacterized protein n=1 Tax=Tanacetum coccineum TaxID=301880 RepID=A0ABQ4ZG08_9ASTR